MFELLFKYPSAVFSKGHLVLLGAWPEWILGLLLIATAVGLALLIRSRVPQAAASVRNWRLGIIWALQFAMAAVLLLLLWQPALLITQLNPQQNIIAVVVDDSRSMGISENGSTRLAQAVKALQGGALTDLQKKFQTRLYRLDGNVTRVTSLDELNASAPVTHIGDGIKQLTDETAGLPIGAIVLLSDGADNSGGIDRDTVAALRSRRIPVHTVGFGEEQVPRDAEVDDVGIASRALANSRLAARVSFHQRGYAGGKTMLRVRDGDKILAAQQVTLAADGQTQTENLLFNVGAAGAKSLQFSLDPLPGETNAANNSVARLVNVESAQRRVLYVEGEPRWEYKFMRRAEDDDHSVQLVSMLRTTENKIYRQGIDDPKELADGFPTKAEDLFKYQGLIIGSVEANYFTPAQQELIQQFVDVRGGGALLLAGTSSLADGGWSASNMANLLPVVLPNHKNTFHRDPATAELTPTGEDSIICRLEEDSARNEERWKKLPYMMNYQDPGTPKPGAAVLADMVAGGHKMPLLITENYGRGRTAVLASEGTWRWQMNLPVGDRTYKDFWQQLLRWLVADTPGPVVASVPSSVLYDDGRVQFSAEVRDKSYQPLPDAQVEAHVLGPGGIAAAVLLTQDPNVPGVFQGEFTAEKSGSYTSEVVAKRGDEEIGRDVLAFQRVDGVAENFHTGQNRELLEKLATETGGRYWQPQQLSSLPSEISYSDAGITTRETKDLWNMPIVFLLILGLCSAEWLLRRKWGIV
jgi:uncharacterized membrane protein